MSYGSVRKQLAEQREQDSTPIHPLRCQANGCPLNGSMANDGKNFICSAHHAVEPHLWPMVTEKLNAHRWMVELTRDLKQMSERFEDWREFATRFWSEDAHCRPHAREEFGPYEARMREELLHRCNLRKVRPAPRLPKEITR